MDPFKIPTPALVSFSGGRTSGYMLYQILKAYKNKLPKDLYITFANTGKEMPETLDFINQCAEKWGVKIHWLELEKDEDGNEIPCVSLFLMGKKRKEWGFVDWFPATEKNYDNAGYRWVHNETYLKERQNG